jgi:hypothetical protein
MRSRVQRARRAAAADAASRARKGGERRPVSGEPQGHSFEDITVFPDAAESVPDPLRAQFERVTRTSLGGVRLHTGPESRAAADELEARAFTIGRDIHFAAGEFRPGTAEGDHLIAHELTHAVQQRHAAPVPQMQSELPEEGDAAEDEADEIADAVLEDDVEDEEEVPEIVERPPAIAMQPKKKKKTKTKTKTKTKVKTASGRRAATPPVRPIAFSLLGRNFKATLDASNNVTVAPARRGGAGGWTFTPAGPNKVNGERTLTDAEYVHVTGAREPLVQRVTVTVPAGGPATVSTIFAEKDSPPTLRVELSSDKGAANKKSLVINGVTIVQLDLPAAAITFVPADGDSIHLARGGDAWVFTTIKPDAPAAGAAPTPATSGFFYVGYLTRYMDHGVPTFGIATNSVSDADRIKAMDDLTKAPTPAGRRITANEAEMFKTVSLIESDFAGVQTYDRGILSFGFAQWTVSGSLPRMLLSVDATTFERYLGRYGLSVGAPVWQADTFVRKFLVAGRDKLGLRNPAEGAISLNNKELVTPRLRTAATTRSAVLDGFHTRATDLKQIVDTAKPNLTSTNRATKAAAVKATADAKKNLEKLRKAMSGLPGTARIADPSSQADALARAATAAKKAADDLLANTISNEVMRNEEWALRFEMLGKSTGGQDAEIAEARRLYTEVSTKDVGGTSFAALLPNLRGRSMLLSSYINNPSSASKMKVAVAQFKAKKKTEAKAAVGTPAAATVGSEADWAAFPWPAGDARWARLWTAAAIAAFEAIAIVEVTKPTTDPARRRSIIASQFP